MHQKINKQFVLAFCISLAFISCNQKAKKDEEPQTTDSAITETVQPPAPEVSMDAVKVAPDLYKIVSDTLGIRVLEATYKPGDSSAMHTHPNSAIYAIEGGTGEFTEKDGTKNVRELKTGFASVRPDDFHSVKNTGKTTMKILLVEVNRPKGTISQDAAMDATKVSPALYKLKVDTLGIRILEANYKPGMQFM
jgi:quercetin dioxygenase-like cupin family protein